MGEFTVRAATPADVDRLWPLFDEEQPRTLRRVGALVPQIAERRRANLIKKLLDDTHPVIVAYSGIRAVGYRILPDGEPFISESWRGLGADEELLDYP